MSRDVLPTARLARDLGALIRDAMELEAFLRFLEAFDEVDPGHAPTHASFEVLHAQLRALVLEGQGLRDMVGFVVRMGAREAV